jgi:ketosteroid isomerase-like protein
MFQSRKLTGFALVFALAACAPEPASETAAMPDFDPATVRAQVSEFVAAWNDSDLASVNSSIADDAVLLQPDGPILTGREAILASISENYDGNLLKQSATVDEVTAAAEAGSDIPSASGYWSVIYKRGPDGSWQTWRWMWNQPSGQTAGVLVTE